MRECPYTRAWVDTAQHINEAHYYAECANRGTCDRTTGTCVCDVGFTGSGCRRMSCPQSCNGHGTCEFIEEMAVDVEDKRIAGSASNTYAIWDQEKIMGCKCDPGYEGHDCSSRMCPRGDDPLTGTTDQSDMKQVIQLAGGDTSTFFLTYYDQYGNAWTTDEIAVASDPTSSGDHDTMCSNIQTALRRLPNHALDGVSVASTTATNAVYTYARTAGADATASGAGSTSDNTDSAFRCIVSFPSEPGTTGLQHLLGCQRGNHAAAGMQPITIDSSPTTCTVLENVISVGLTVNKLTEGAVCSNRGTCDSSTGVCECFAGHKGTACETQEALV